MTDPIADMLTRIRNALAARRDTVSFPYSKIKEAIVKILQENKYVESYEVVGEGSLRQIKVSLDLERTHLTAMQRLSKPGRRLYAGAQEIPTILGGRGMVIISTPGGIMTGQQARKQRLGGELICKVW